MSPWFNSPGHALGWGALLLRAAGELADPAAGTGDYGRRGDECMVARQGREAEAKHDVGPWAKVGSEGREGQTTEVGGAGRSGERRAATSAGRKQARRRGESKTGCGVGMELRYLGFHSRVV